MPKPILYKMTAAAWLIVFIPYSLFCLRRFWVFLYFSLHLLTYFFFGYQQNTCVLHFVVGVVPICKILFAFTGAAFFSEMAITGTTPSFPILFYYHCGKIGSVLASSAALMMAATGVSIVVRPTLKSSKTIICVSSSLFLFIISLFFPPSDSTCFGVHLPWKCINCFSLHSCSMISSLYTPF